MARALEARNRGRRDRGERRVAEMSLDEAQALLFKLDRPRQQRIRLAARYASIAADKRLGPCSFADS